MTKSNYIQSSLELHLFFARIMKEHSFFLAIAFMEQDAEMKRIAQQFEQTFSTIIKNAIKLANGNISNDLLTAEEIVTKNTISAENKTNKLIILLQQREQT